MVAKLLYVPLTPSFCPVAVESLVESGLLELGTDGVNICIDTNLDLAQINIKINRTTQQIK